MGGEVEGTGQSRGREGCDPNILYERESLFLTKEKRIFKKTCYVNFGKVTVV